MTVVGQVLVNVYVNVFGVPSLTLTIPTPFAPPKVGVMLIALVS